MSNRSQKYPHGAIFMGVNKYGAPSGLTELNYAYEDAKSLCQVFIKNGYPKECCLLLPNESLIITRSEITEPIEQLIQKLDDIFRT